MTAVITRTADGAAACLRLRHWLAEAGFNTGTGVTVRVSEGCLTIIADSNEVWELREELYQVKQVIKEIKEVLV